MVSHPRNPHRLFFLYFTDRRLDQREGMGLLEYRALPSLRDVAHGGVFCVHLVIDQPQTGASGVVRQGRRHGPSIMCQNHPLLGHSSSSQPGGPPCWASPLAFGLLGLDAKAS
jgi:hypothetical protein